MKRISAALAALTLVAASPLGGRVTVLSNHDAPRILRQCSRGTPAPGEAWFRPSAAEIDALERAVVIRSGGSGRMQTQDHAIFDSVRDLLSRYDIDVVGIVRHGRRFVYGSFVPAGRGARGGGPTIVCDGGIAVFGAEYDIGRGIITHFAENGSN